ncbi:MAG TPA: CNNM domain-containing protein [Candidatus Saccharimonadales bacterium]|nr:CNNM domain-containing protein [Candidatus Saccharimonadales bacterium]
MYLFILTVILLVGFSAMCSGLNVAIMSLDAADLRRKARLGNAAARSVLPLRKNAHLTLAGILLTNVAAVSATSLVMEGKFNGIVAGIASTLLIVIFGEIFPQAIFARRALLFCARFAPALKVMIFLTYPVSKPLQLLLDKLFHEQGSQLQSRHELGMMISEHLGNNTSELDNDEVEIIRGALQLSEKHVRDIMTPIDHVFWLMPDTKMNSAKIDEIKANGWSRIPVLNRQRSTCFGVLLMKDLVDVNFDQESLRTDDLPLYPTQIVGSMTALDTLFRKFIIGGVHLIPVEREDKIIGIVTIEDLLEEIVGHEIEDETDRRKANRRGLRAKK